MKKFTILLFTIMSCCATWAYGDQLKVCATRSSTTAGSPSYQLISGGSMITTAEYQLPGPGACENIALKVSRTSLIGKSIDVELKTFTSFGFQKIGAIVYSQLSDFNNCYISIEYKDYTGFSFKGRAGLACVA